MPIYSFSSIQPKIDPSAFIHPDAIIIGDVTIGPDSSVWPGVVIRGDVNKIVIGSQTNIQDGSILHVTRPTPENPEGTPLIIGDQVLIGHQVSLHACSIKNRAMVGIGAIVLDGACIGEQAMLGAGSMLTPGKVIEADSLWLGSPAKFSRPRRKDEIDATAKTIASYCTLAATYKEGLQIPQSIGI
ncbi:MAG: gamma carbonic anhydrase family protein [Magnetococcales bacterium]|nr:gamma carbonic anhydrase family protein [Magnetococcales bacterium]